MDDTEKTSDSLLLEEAMTDNTENSAQDASGDMSAEGQDLIDENLGMVEDGALVEGVIENEDVEMADGVTEDSENNNLAPEDSMDAPAAILEGEDESELSQGTLTTSEAFLGDQFISPTDSLIVQSEPPQQLMEEADLPGEDETEGDGTDISGADTTNELSDILETDQTGEDLAEGDEESILLHQEEGGTAVAQPDESGNVDLGALPDGMTLVSGDLEEGGDEDAGADEAHGEDLQGAENVEGAEEGDDEDGTEDGAEGLALLASELEGKIAAASDGSVHLTGQENLQGMQLMEGDDDDKPEEEAEAALEGETAQPDIQAVLNAALMKQEEMKTEDEDQPESDAFSDAQPSAESDALATLASAALDHQAPTNGVKNELDESNIKTESEADAQDPQWMDVGICKGTHCQVRSYYIPRTGLNWDQNWEGITTSTLPDHRTLAKLELESGKAYKFRVAAINSCGRGPWSEVAAFKTSLPGFPGAPSAIKIAKTTDGAHLSWEPPPIASGVIEDYHVYLAVRTATTDSSRQVVSSGANQLAFVRIYQGAANQCTVGNDTLSKAHIDMTTKPAILFRISARNEKGIGPATQVRWLQEVGAPNNNAARPTYAPRRPATETKPHGNYKRKKSE
ncbi:hypothetical protein ONE63_004303 [Megalurothrips usitatus]|uniref:Fibronectin type-III domain-containing protein n=1 Tax=Megalurothrips usitatus TaxID=439358 RepID=A0AAV7X2D9_9NEOP|nr:hypothetical protein ONE63_004303 [Megalurothrips usitatus]